MTQTCSRDGYCQGAQIEAVITQARTIVGHLKLVRGLATMTYDTRQAFEALKKSQTLSLRNTLAAKLSYLENAYSR